MERQRDGETETETEKRQRQRRDGEDSIKHVEICTDRAEKVDRSGINQQIVSGQTADRQRTDRGRQRQTDGGIIR